MFRQTIRLFIIKWLSLKEISKRFFSGEMKIIPDKKYNAVKKRRVTKSISGWIIISEY